MLYKKNEIMKDLAEEYLAKAKENAIYFKNGNFPNMPLYQEGDIKAAFNAGCESVVENASEIEWEDIGMYGEKAMYVDVCKAHKPLEEFLIQEWFYPKDIELHGNDFTKKGFKTIEEAKAYAKEAYKKRIKQSLGL